jgi:putative hydrolase of the HAD superfamily
MSFTRHHAHASSTVFTAIHEEEQNVNIDDLQASDHDILRSKAASAFTDGKTSTEYRRDNRFFLLLQAHGLGTPTERLDHLSEVYKGSLRAALSLKAGSLQLFARLKSLGKKVIVVTEGPQDAQEWTVQELGLQPSIDILITTNKIGKSKIDGLFPAVLEEYDIAASDMVYVGDNEKRDSQLEDSTAFCVNSLTKLEHLIE